MYVEAVKKLTSTQWEFFAEDVLWHIGYEILEGPSEGADQGKDLVVRKGDRKYLVSCKHYLKSDKAIGPSIEENIVDRVFRHKCNGFITFYSTHPSSNLKSEFSQLSENERLDIDFVEFNQSEIFDIIPTLTGFTLQKYFKEPEKLYHHINDTGWEYFPLRCQNPECGKDLLSKENINNSSVNLIRINNMLELVYGCKSCLPDLGKPTREYNEYIETIKYFEGDVEVFWWEFSQIRYIEELTDFNNVLRLCLNHPDFIMISPYLYKSWSEVQSAILQVMVPIHWGKWTDHKRTFSVPSYTGFPLSDLMIHIRNNKDFEKKLIEKSTNRKT